MDTDTDEINKPLETPAPEPVKNSQFHCALNNTPTCLFQCNNREELNRHIERIHNTKTQLQCSVCMIFLRDLDALANHKNMAHKDDNPH